jgi:uncharacterized damage-inducible protein DinB
MDIMTTAEAQTHLRYSAWASRKLMDAVRAMDPRDLEKPVGISHGSLLGTLGHILFADWIWYTRVIAPMEKPAGTLEALEQVWPDLQRKWVAWAGGLTDAGLLREIAYKGMDGLDYRNPTWQIVMHVVNHATLHRGQAMGMLRQMGVAPPHTDLLYYYREQAAAAPAN